MRQAAQLLLLTLGASVATAATSSKRGLVFVPNEQWRQDSQIWVEPGSDLTWYYNYKPTPAPSFVDVPQDKFEFVPMMWGKVDGTEFLDSVTQQMGAGHNISHVLGFNEPDGAVSGGSNLDPESAAQIWVNNMEPLAKRGVKLGMPAVTGSDRGVKWTQNFATACTKAFDNKNCTFDFLPIHFYGSFEGLASHMGSLSAAFPNVTQWITEYNWDNQDLSTTQSFFNTTCEYFDRLPSVARYSYFGSFRSKVSNVGPNAVMLNNDGELTDIGSWYLGGSATGVNPQSAAGKSGASVLAAAAAAGIAGMVLASF
ncbi:glycoside hydrolase- catalytic core [Apiospora marii]|uniref:Glycoside hydrolase- catalytic core n=1 Tax=Apiospora marii TaxID=335849 RepID=A0ABR1SH65_9PEZI